MSANQVLEEIHKLPLEEQFQVFEQLRDEFEERLTPAQVAELDRRAEDALKNPGVGTSWDQLRDEMLSKYKK